MNMLRHFKFGLLALAGWGLSFGAWAQCDNYGKQASESRLKQEQLTNQYKQGVLELKQGLFCSDCRRRKSEFDRIGEDFSAHIAKGAKTGRRAVAATQNDYDQLHANYERDFLREVSKVEQSNKSQADCEERERQQAFAKQQDAQRRQQDEARQRAESQRQAQEQAAAEQRQRQAEAQLLRQQQELANLQQSAAQHQQLSDQNADRLQKVTESLSQVSDRIRQDVGQYTSQLRQRWNGSGSDQGSNLEDLSAPNSTFREDAATLGNAIYDRALEFLPNDQPAVRLLNAYGNLKGIVGSWQSLRKGDVTGLLENIPISPGTLWGGHILPMLGAVSKNGDNVVNLANDLSLAMGDLEDPAALERLERNVDSFGQRFVENIPVVGWFAKMNRRVKGNQPARQGNLMFNGSSFFGN